MYKYLEEKQKELENMEKGPLIYEPSHYAYGRCHIFADALNEELNYEMEFLWDDAFYSEDSEEMSVLIHAYCRDRKGEYIDVRGKVTKDFILNEYEYNEIRKENVTRERLEKMYEWGILEKPTEEEKKKIKTFIQENEKTYGGE